MLATVPGVRATAGEDDAAAGYFHLGRIVAIAAVDLIAKDSRVRVRLPEDEGAVLINAKEELA
jgi:hypothetical protein